MMCIGRMASRVPRARGRFRKAAHPWGGGAYAPVWCLPHGIYPGGVCIEVEGRLDVA